MQPFAVHKPTRSRTPWIVVAAVFAAFMIWYLDLVPRIRSVATGSLADRSALPQFDEMTDVNAERPWDEIVDRSQMPSTAADLADDPLLSALSHQTEPVVPTEFPLAEPQPLSTSTGLTAEKSDPGPGPIRDRAVRSAGFEISSRPDLTATIATVDDPPPVIPAELAAQLRQIDVLFRDQQLTTAHAELSQLYWKRPEYRTFIKSRLEHTAMLLFTSPDLQFEDPYVVAFGDTLSSIADKYQLSWPYLARLNRTSPERLQAGQTLKVVTGPFSAVVDLRDFALTVHAHGWFIHRYRIGIGADGQTPTGEFTVREKLENPTWYNPDGGQIDADDPLNPLGEFWLGLGNHIGIHGTIDADSIGATRSRGCIHLADGDIEEVFHLLSVGSKVLIRN